MHTYYISEKSIVIQIPTQAVQRDDEERKFFDPHLRSEKYQRTCCTANVYKPLHFIVLILIIHVLQYDTREENY